MKKLVYLTALIFTSLFLALCTKPTEPEFNNPYDERSSSFIAQPGLNTIPISSVSAISAISGGQFSNDYGYPVTRRGVCFHTASSPGLQHRCTQDGSGLGQFTSRLDDLAPNTRYFVRAYATNQAGTTYGNELSFVTRDGIAQLSTNSITSITVNSAQTGGQISDDGGAPITLRGVCWSTSPNPTRSNSCVNSGSGVGSFSATMTNLSPGTRYYVRAFAVNSVGTHYGLQREFVTQNIRLVPVRSSRWITQRGSGTSANPFVGYSNNQFLNNTTAFVEYRVEGGNVRVHYTISVSSEVNRDFLNLRIGNTLVQRISGSASRSGTWNAANGTIIRIEYTKDRSISRLNDRGYINSLYITPN